jgi:hypothetical protein
MQALERLKPSEAVPDDFVFQSTAKTLLSPNNVRNRVLIPACKRAAIPVVGWHTFRYTYSTWADPSGESIKALQNQLGHVDSKITLGVYVQPISEVQRRIAAKVRGGAPNCSQTFCTRNRVGGRNPVKGREIDWRARRDSNSRPIAPEAIALSS